MPTYNNIDLTPTEIQIYEEIIKPFHIQIRRESLRELNCGGCGIGAALLSNAIIKKFGIQPQLWMFERSYRHSPVFDKFIRSYFLKEEYSEFELWALNLQKSKILEDGKFVPLFKVRNSVSYTYSYMSFVMNMISQGLLPKDAFNSVSHFYLQVGNLVFDGEYMLSWHGMNHQVEISTIVNGNKITNQIANINEPTHAAEADNFHGNAMAIDMKYLIPILTKHDRWNSIYFSNRHKNNRKLVDIHNNIVK